MIGRGKKVGVFMSPFFLCRRREMQSCVGKVEAKDMQENYDELSFLNNDIKHNLYRLKCIEQKKIKSDRIVYKKILKDLLKKKEKFIADDMINFFYILIYNDLYYLDICSNFFSYFYQHCVYSKKYLNNVHVNSIVQIIYSFHVFENYNFFSNSRHIFPTQVVEPESSRHNCNIGNGNYLTKRNDPHIDNERHKVHYHNGAYSTFHIYNHLSEFIYLNIEHINKSHIIKILLPLSQFVFNSTVTLFTQHNSINPDEYKKQMNKIGKNLFLLIESFVEKINITKGIKKSYSAETTNEKEIKKKKERYSNLIDNSYRNYIYIDNDSNDNKLICLFFYILSKLFFPISPNFFLKMKNPLDSDNPIDEHAFGQAPREEEPKLGWKKNDHYAKLEISEDAAKLEINDESCNPGMSAHMKDEEKNFVVVDLFMSHYKKNEMRNNVFYKNTHEEKSNVENFQIYKNNILKAMKKYVFLDDIYSLNLHYKMVFFKAIYSLHFFNFPFLRDLFLIYSYMNSSKIDNFDQTSQLHFFSLHEGDDQACAEIAEMEESMTHKDVNVAPVDEQKRSGETYDEGIKKKITQLAKRGDLFNNVYINLLSDIENSIKNCTAEEALNTLFHMHLLRFVDNHFIIALISKLCNSTDKLRTEHKKKMNVIVIALLSFLSPHIHSIMSFQKGLLYNINVFNHIYCNNDVYVDQLKRLRDFVELLHNKQIFKRKRKELLSWSNYKHL
ncbi:hypothetical protein, conserved [Plasmodium gonderi]|uniref:Uncharacterized protein n=1 Tax=Plasmodium gonderi TaxID=77519 RepID=A0A1Y1JQ84_PLAGO|nr:hypothetical protein, conserved [Plasmodium gonderi]GAW83658.1 hypothetical protein, conserved [Plasmodium gonderi]